MRLDPRAADFYLLEVGWGYNAMRKYEAAISALKKHLVHFPNDGWAHANLAIAYSETGQKELARAEALEIRRINPNVSLKTTLHPYLWGDRALFARYRSDLREAGLS
jgi:tetratricopeptide (TPR) repeat protein